MVNLPNDTDSNRKNKDWELTNEDLKSILTTPNTKLEERSQILWHLKQIAEIDRESGKPFCVILNKDINSQKLIPLLSTIVPLFEGWDEYKEQISVFVHNMILSAKENVDNLEKVIFIWNPRMDAGDMSPEFGDRINKENSIDIWDEKGNGWYYDDAKIQEPLGSSFVHVSVTEHLISKKPNAAVVVFTEYLNPRHTMLLNGIQEGSPVRKL